MNEQKRDRKKMENSEEESVHMRIKGAWAERWERGEGHKGKKRGSHEILPQQQCQKLRIFIAPREQ